MAATPDIKVTMVQAGSLTVCVREQVGYDEGWPVVFIHGNVSSSPFFFPAMEALPEQYRPIAIDLRGFGGTDTLPVDATRGLRDFADDVRATLSAMALDQVNLVGWSMGGGVVLQVLLDAPELVRTVTLINPVSPYGFGGTDANGRPVFSDGAGSGGGTVNADFVAAIDAGEPDRGGPASPRNTLRSFYVAPGWDREFEEDYLASMLSTSVGPDNYPGDAVTSPNWPGTAPGTRGVLNTMAPTYLDLTGIVDVQPKPPILWVRGELDRIVSDQSMFDLAQLGAAGAVPGYPGAEKVPPQPMVTQTRDVLERYAAAGGRYTEVVIPGVGHSPHIEDTPAFAQALADFLPE